MSIERPFFFSLWCKLIAQDFKEGNYSAFLPWKLGLCLVAGYFLVFKIDYAVQAQNIFYILIAILTANGILAAIIINSVQQVLANISHPQFAAILRKSNVLDYYLFFVMFFQGIMTISLVIIVASIFFLLMDFDSFYKVMATAIAVGMFFYCLIQAISSALLVRDLIYYRSLFEGERDSDSNF